jgi:hypothetical protein
MLFNLAVKTNDASRVEKQSSVDSAGERDHLSSSNQTTTTTPSTSRKQAVYLIKEDDLKVSLIRLGTLIQERERSNFEQYTMFYENLLRQQHQLLYNREREVRSLKSILDGKIFEINVEVQCQMADACYDLILGNCRALIRQK